MEFARKINAYLVRHLTPAVRQIFLANVYVFIGIQIGLLVMPRIMQSIVFDWWALTPAHALKGFRVWQFASYMFVHVSGFHILLNMMILWYFGPELESRWGTSRFWRFYLYSGIGAGIVTSAIWLATGWAEGPAIGASGALAASLLAFWAYNPQRMAYFWGFIRIEIRYLIPLIVILGGFAMHRTPGISLVTHVAGAAVAFYYLHSFHRTWDIRRWRYR